VDKTKGFNPWGWLLMGVVCLPVSTILLLPAWAVSLGLQLRREWPRWEHGPLAWLGGLSLGLVGVTLLSYRPWESLAGLFNYLPFFLFFWLITRLTSTPERLGTLLTWSLGAAGVTGVVGVTEWLSGRNWQWKILGVLEVTMGSEAEAGVLDRVTSFFFWPTSTAAYLLLVIPLALTFWVGHPQPRVGLTLLGGGLFALVALVGTASRNAWGAMTLALSLLLVYTRRWVTVLMLAVAVAGVLVAAVGPTTWPVVAPLRQVVPQFLWQKIANTFDSRVTAYESTTERLEAWRIASEMALARPWTGWGPQTFPYVGVDIYRKKGPTIHAHNLYLTYCAELGFPLTMALLGFYAWVMMRAALALPWLPLAAWWWTVGLLLGLVGYFCFGLFDVAFYESRVNAQFWLWLALLWQVADIYKPYSRNSC